MGVNGSSRNSRAYYPSGPRLDGYSPPPPPPGNPDPSNYQLVRAEEGLGKYLIVMIKYPDCKNYEGNKILVFKDVTLIELVNQKLIDPHFFPGDDKRKSPIARFVPTEEGWQMALVFVKALWEAGTKCSR